MDKFGKKYKKIRQIGSGAFGKIFLVQNRQEDRLAVVKVVDVSSLSEQETQAVLNEIKIMELLEHPYTVKIFDHLILQKSVSIVMQYAEEGDLEAKIRARNGLLFEKDVYCRWIAQLLCGLHHIHSQNILHRDLKSQNVFLTGRNNVIIGDFGVSKRGLLGETFVGTPYYLSPEILTDTKYTKKADIWSLGVLFYELVSLRYPFTVDCMSLPALAMKILKGQYPDMPQAVDPAVKTMIRSMLSVDPNSRPTLTQLMGYSFAWEVLRLEDTLPANVPKQREDSLKPSIAKPICIEFEGVSTPKRGGQPQSRAQLAGKSSSKLQGAFQRSKSKKTAMNKALPSSRSNSRGGLQPRAALAEKKTPGLFVHSKQYDAKVGSHKNDESSKVFRKPPVPTRDHKKTHVDATKSAGNTLADYRSGQLKSESETISSVSPSKVMNVRSEAPKESDVFDLLHICRKVDEQYGITHSSDTPHRKPKASKLPLMKEIEEECEEFTEGDLTIQVSEVIKNKVFPTPASGFCVRKSIASTKEKLKKTVGEDMFAKMFDSIQSALPKDDSFTENGRVSYLDSMKQGGIPQDVFDKYSKEVEEVAIYERIFEESQKANQWETQFLDERPGLDSSEVLQVHLAH